MIFAGIGDTPYNIILILHILTAMAAFAPAFVHPVLSAQMKADGMADRPKVFGYMATNAQRIYGSALIVSGLLGFGVAGMSDDFYKMSQGWLAAAFIIWIGMNGLLHAVIRPSEKAIAAAEGGEADEKKLAIAGVTMTLLLVVQVYLMVWKPGL